MERADITKHVLEYAHNRIAPFTAADAFDNIDAIETAKQVSDSLGRLYNQRILARRKVDKVRYEYIRAEIRPVGFEMAPELPASEPKTPEPEKKAMKNNADSAESVTIAMQRMAKMATRCIPEKKPDTPQKPTEPTTLNIQFRKPEAEQKQNTQPESEQDWLKKAHDIVHGDREKTYGDPGKNLRLIAQYWSAHTGITLTETDVCIMMMMLKIARLRNDQEHDDSWIDIIGYAALKNRINNECNQKANS